MQSRYDLEKAFAMFDQGHILREVAAAIGCPPGTARWIKEKWRNIRTVEVATPAYRKPLTAEEQAKADSFMAEWEDACERREFREAAEAAAVGRTVDGKRRAAAQKRAKRAENKRWAAQQLRT